MHLSFRFFISFGCCSQKYKQLLIIRRSSNYQAKQRVQTMRSQSSVDRVSGQKDCDSNQKSRFLNKKPIQKDISFTEYKCPNNMLSNYHQETQPVIKQHIQDPNFYVWQDFLTIFQYTSEQRQKLNYLLPKGFSFISKQDIPENIKTQLGHYARRMNLKIEYQKKEAEQALKNPVCYIQFDPQNLKYLQPQQTTFQPLQSRVEQSNKIQEKTSEKRDFSEQNKVVLRLKKGQKMVDDLSVFAHPIYQKMHNIVVFKRLLHPANFAKQKEKQIKKQREIERIRRIKEARKAKLQKIAGKKKEDKMKRVESRKQLKKNRTINMSKKSSKNKLPLQNPKLNLQFIAIKELIQKLQKHQHFQILIQAHTTPTIKCLLKILKAKIQRNYKIHQFETDLLRIFKVYYKTSKEKSTVVRNIKNYQKFMKNAIENQKIIFSNQQNQNIKKQPESKLINTISTKTKNKRSQNLLKNKTKDYEIQNIQKLGKNVCRLNQKNAEQFCIEFCNPQCQKQEGEAFIFQFDFNKENTSRLIEMENFVKQKLEEQKSAYVALSDEDISQQFVIENDYDD